MASSTHSTSRPSVFTSQRQHGRVRSIVEEAINARTFSVCECVVLVCMIISVVLILFSNTSFIVYSGSADDFFSQNNSLKGLVQDESYREPFKVYVYDLPPMYNNDFLTYLKENETQRIYCSCLQDAVGLRINTTKLTDQPEYFRDGSQFCLEVIFHERLMRQKEILTDDPREANVFYIPFYVAMDQTFEPWPIPVHPPTKEPRPRGRALSRAFFTLLGRHPVYREIGGKNHVITLGRVQAEFYKNSLNFLRDYRPFTDFFYYFGIERIESKEAFDERLKWGDRWKGWNRMYQKYSKFVADHKKKGVQGDELRKSIDKAVDDKVLEPTVYSKLFRDAKGDNLPTMSTTTPAEYHHVMPYPAAVHLVNGEPMPWRDHSFRIVSRGEDGVIKWKRLVLAVFNSRFEERVQMEKLCRSYDDKICLFRKSNFGMEKTFYKMRETVFCLNPRGDSWTRRGIYDALSCGCISVHFQNDIVLPWNSTLQYNPFEYSYLLSNGQRYSVKNRDYVPKIEDMSVIVPADRIGDYVEYLKEIPQEKILEMQKKIEQYGNFYVYSYPPKGVYTHGIKSEQRDPYQLPDAFDIALEGLRQTFRDKPLKGKDINLDQLKWHR